MKRLLIIPMLLAALLLLFAACDAKDPADTTAEDTTAAELTDAPTDAPTDTPDNGGGCASVVAIGVLVTLISCSAVVLCKRKED